MPPALWPSDLPRFPKYPLQEELPDNVVRSETETGPPKLRRRTTRPLRPFTLTYILTKQQKTTLDDFFTETLAHGSLEFQHNLPDDADQQGVFIFRKPPAATGFSPDGYQVQVDVLLVRKV